MDRLIPIILVIASLQMPVSQAAETATDPLGPIVVPDQTSSETLLQIVREALSTTEPAIAAAELRIEHVREGLAATHHTYSQWVGERRVFGGELVISVGRDGRVLGRHVSLSSTPRDRSWRTDLLEDLRGRHPELRGARVVDRTRAYRNFGGRAGSIERFTVEDAPFRFTVWEVDSTSGEVLSKTPSYASVIGRVFPVNPVTTLNDDSLRDQGDLASAVPEEAYLDTTLMNLPAAGHLEGPRVRVIDIDSPFTSRARIEQGLRFDRDRDEFEEVNAYHHLDEAQLYLQSLGYTDSRQIVPGGVRVDVHANRGADNSFFTATSAGATLLFGDGGVDDAEDPDIILHEYAHAIHDSIAPGVLFGGFASEGRAVSEGFGDYWAFSTGYAAARTSGRDPYCIGDWDARCDGPGCAYPANADCLRRVDLELTTDDFSLSNASGTEHQNGRIWSSFLRDVFESLVARHGESEGRRMADTLTLEGLHGLPSQPLFEHLVANMVQADAVLFGAANRTSVCTAAEARKFDLPPACRPLMRGETIVVPGAGGVLIHPGVAVERQLTLRSDAIVDRVLIALEFAASTPEDLEISLIAPDGAEVLLKSAGSILPLSVTIGRDRLPAEPLDEVEDRPNPGVWRLKFLSSSELVALLDWGIFFELEGAAKLNSRVEVVGARFIPAVAHTPGAEGTFFVSDLAVANTGESAELMLIFSPSGEDGTESYSAIRIDSPADESFVLRDFVNALFETEGTGSLEIRGAGPEMRISSRTYNRAPSGSFGQTIPLVRDAAGVGGRLIISQVRRNLQYRTNVGLAETSGTGTTAVVTLRDLNGVAVGTSEVILGPFGHRQIPLASFAAVSELSSGWVEVDVTGSGGMVSAYSSVVDNRTGDSVFVPAVHVSASRRTLMIPAAGRTPGARDTLWRTDLWLVNESGEGEQVVMTFFRAEGPPISALVTVGPRSSTLLEDVIGEVFATEGTGWIRVDETAMAISSRTWNDDPSGSYGQFIGALSSEDTAGRGDTLVVPQVVMNQSFRTNVGVTEVTGTSASLRIDIMNSSGSLECSLPIEIAPFQQWQVSVSQIGCGTIDGGRVEMHHLDGEGRIVAYASIVDQNSGDPSYIRAE